MKTHIFLVLVLIFIGCSALKVDDYSLESVYPAEIIKLGLEDRYDKAKWQLYCMYSDEKIQFTKSSKVKITNAITFGMTALRFDSLLIYGDTVEINFYFYYNDMQLHSMNVENFIANGVVYVGGSDTIILYPTEYSRYVWKKCDPPHPKCPYREINPLQPDVIKYIRNNKEKIDPWFRKEAIKRGVIKE